MAQLVPPAAARALQSTTNLDASDGILAGEIPTDEQIVRENHLLYQIEKVQEGGDGGMNEGDYSGAIIRHHKVLSLRADHELGNVNITVAAQLTAIQNQLTLLNERYTQLNGRFDAMNGRFDAMDAARLADRARIFNSRIDSSSSASRRLQFRPVVKYIRGHPQPGLPPAVARLPPAVGNVNIQPEYVLGAQPPEGLIPLNHADFDKMIAEPIDVLRRRLRAIFWFYNVDSLRLTANASRNACDNAIQNLKDHYFCP